MWDFCKGCAKLAAPMKFRLIATARSRPFAERSISAIELTKDSDLTATIESLSHIQVDRRDARARATDRDCCCALRDLVKVYRDGTEANRGISLEVRRGEVVAYSRSERRW